MLLFEFDGSLFQFEQREPESDPLFQLPPKIPAFLPSMPLRSSSFDPTSKHRPNFCQNSLSRLQLMLRHAFDRKKKSHPKPQMSQSSICSIYLAYLI
jgi:hypothetical protein